MPMVYIPTLDEAQKLLENITLSLSPATRPNCFRVMGYLGDIRPGAGGLLEVVGLLHD